jgi:hypothetical protein
MKQRFFKLNSRWYADVPGHTLEDNEMVCGADALLEEISRFQNSPEVTLDLDIEPSDFPFATLKQIEHDEIGTVTISQDSDKTIHVKGGQKSKTNSDYLEIDGTLTVVNPLHLQFTGEIITCVDHINNGNPV